MDFKASIIAFLVNGDFILPYVMSAVFYARCCLFGNGEIYVQLIVSVLTLGRSIYFELINVFCTTLEVCLFLSLYSLI